MKAHHSTFDWKLVSLIIAIGVLVGLMLFGGAHHPQLLW
jgi:hypothetical protein